MNVLRELRRRFAAALEPLVADPQARAGLVDLVGPSQDSRFGDYQANFAMPLGKQLGQPPRRVAEQVVAAFDPGETFHSPDIAGPGFINIRLNDAWLAKRLTRAVHDPRLDVEAVEAPRTYIVDFSAPNVAKPMHVGHIRSTVIGDSICRILKFVGHRVTSDNHLGDWGTQFGMIIYGYKHWLDAAAFERSPVDELARLYRLVHRLLDIQETRAALPRLQRSVEQGETELARAEGLPGGDASLDKKRAQAVKKSRAALDEARRQRDDAQAKLTAADADSVLSKLLADHANIGEAVLAETAKLHAGDAENLALWRAFMPPCLAAIEAIYQRLNVSFDVTLGESFYHDRLAAVAKDLEQRGLARESDGALCVFMPEFDAPMIVRKKDGAFLYATTDLATLRYRLERWQPDAILYVVDHRQSFHFQQLFAVARQWDCGAIELCHVSFGTVLGEDGRPYKTRSGDTVGLSGLLDEAVDRASKIVAANNPELPEAERQRVAEIVGLGALKYADLSQHRTSDYTFSYDKMLAMTGNTATYMQYAYARVRSIFRKGEIDVEALRQLDAPLLLDAPEERQLARWLMRFSEALEHALADYRPNQLTTYLFDLANAYSTFFEACPVLKAENDAQRSSRLRLCDLTARTIRTGLDLLGIQVVEQM